MATLKDKIRKIGEKFRREKKVLKGEKSKDKIYSSKKNYPDEADARRALSEAKKKLFNIALWSEIPRLGTSAFELYDKDGNAYPAEKPSIGNFIKILLPGPFPENWVEVIDVREEENFSEFTARPSNDPTDKKQSTEVTEHFFQSKATSTFRVERKENTIIAYEIGKNEAINQKEPEAGGRSGVNILISEGGWAGFQKLQWKNLTDYLVGHEEIK